MTSWSTTPSPRPPRQTADPSADALSPPFPRTVRPDGAQRNERQAENSACLSFCPSPTPPAIRPGTRPPRAKEGGQAQPTPRRPAGAGGANSLHPSPGSCAGAKKTPPPARASPLSHTSLQERRPPASGGLRPPRRRPQSHRPKTRSPGQRSFPCPHSATARPKGLPPQVVPTPSAALRKRAGQSKGQRARARAREGREQRQGEHSPQKSLPCRGRLHRPRHPPPPQISRFGGCALPHSAAAPLSTAPLPKAL